MPSRVAADYRGLLADGDVVAIARKYSPALYGTIQPEVSAAVLSTPPRLRVDGKITLSGSRGYKGETMPARVVVVHDEPGFVDELVAALNFAGHQVAVFPDPLAAWDALAVARLTEVLITRVRFPPGKSNGLALAHMARANRRAIQVIFTALPEFARECENEGVFLPMPMPVSHVVKNVELLLQRGENSDARSAGASLNLAGEGNGRLPIEPPLGRTTRSHPL